MINRREFMGNVSKVAAGGAAASLVTGLADRAAAQSATAPVTEPIAQTGAGRVRGRVDNGVYVFKGIPYGAAMRFMPPGKAQPWTAVRDALEFGPMCPQGNGQGNQSEDCLALNIWTRGLNDGRRRPVMVWLHGGGFQGGNGGDPRADGVNLCNRGDVVVVTVNNRLNVFGWLYLAELGGEEYAASGAVGMLDQVAALQWIRDNIARFGGDPNNVTIWGLAGGARKCSSLLVMPAAKGLFHRAIVESGAQLRLHTREVATEMASAVLRELGLKENQVGDLRSIPFQKLNAAGQAVQSRQATSIYGKQGIYVQLGFVPAVDGIHIPTHIFDPFGPVASASVPLLVGTNKHESGNALKADPKIDAETLTEDELKARVELIAGIGNQGGRLIDYYRDTFPHASPAERYVQMCSHRAFGFDVLTMAERKLAQRGGAVYKYQFAWEAPPKAPGWKAFHELNCSFAFDNTTKVPAQSGGSPQAAALAARMADAWIAFARTGNPSTPSLPWPAYTRAGRQIMGLNNECHTGVDPSVDERHVWATIYTGLSSSGT